MENIYLYLGVSHRKAEYFLSEGHLFGRHIVTDTIRRAFDFGEIVIGFPEDSIKKKHLFSTAEETFSFQLFGEENEYEIKCVTLPTENLSIHYEWHEDCSIPIEILEFENRIRQKHQITMQHHLPLYRDFHRQPQGKSKETRKFPFPITRIK